MKFDEIKKIIENIAPLEYGEDWDNTGVQIRTEKNKIEKILVAMEINQNVLEEAISLKADMIVTHHPLVFSKITTIDYSTVQGRYLIEAIKNDISVYSAHLTFDNAPGGNNFYLAELLGLKGVDNPKKNPKNLPGVMGTLEVPLKLIDICQLIVEKWDIPKEVLRVAGDMEMEISKIALCSGAGGDLVSIAVKEECQLLITGDTKLHQAQKALAEGIAFIDAGHYDTEKQFVENMAGRLEKKTKDVEIIRSEARVNPFSYLI